MTLAGDLEFRDGVYRLPPQVLAVEGDVGQHLPAALGLYVPATLEIRPGYVTEIFNPQVSLRRGVPFHALAGVPIVEGFQSPCTDVPSDRLIVAVYAISGLCAALAGLVLIARLDSAQPIIGSSVGVFIGVHRWLLSV